MELDATAIVAITGLIGSLVAIGKLLLDKRKTTVDISTNITRVATELVDDLRQEIDRLKIEVEALRERDLEHRKEIARLSVELLQARERITALETESEMLMAENEKLKGQYG